MASNEEDATLLIDDLDTLSYFSPTLTRKPSPLPSTSTIISSLLSSAGLPSSYPPADLTTLITAIEISSTFDTLRRNGLLLYLLIDVSTSPSVVDAFCNARLIPTFWRTSVEAYHAFDHGQYARAMPYLSKENAEPYTELVLRRLDPKEDAKLARYALQFVKVARPDVVQASREAQQAVLIAKAIGEGLAAALDLARTIDPAASAAQALWPWLFAKRRPKLLAEFVRLPLTPAEVQGVRQFALAPTSSSFSTSTAAAQRRAIDALLLRLLNAGQVVEALRLDREAEEHGLGGDEEGDEASVAAIKQRREMLRLARQSLPATLRLELEDDDGEDGGSEGGLNGRAGAGMQVDGAGDVSMTAGGSRAPSRTGPTLNTSRTAATPSSPLVTLPRSASRNLALASQSPLAGSGFASSSSSFTGSPRPQPRGGLPLPRAGYASPSPRPATSALPSTAAAAAARQGDTSMQASTSFSSSNAGPYARLAAQLASAQPQGANANDSGSGSALLSSLLPQKRAALSSASLASRGGASGDTIMAPATGAEGDVSMDRTMTPPPVAAGSAFEVPKRRYIPKSSATGEDGHQTSGRARGQRQRSQAADGAAAKSRAARGVGASPHKKQRQMMERDEQEVDEEEEEPVKERQTTTKARMPRSRSTMPGSFFGDDEEMHEGQHEEEPEEQQTEVATPSTRASRTAKGKQGNAGATTARRGSKDAAAAASTATPRRKTTTTSSRRRRETSTASSLAATSPSAHGDEDEGDETYAPPTTRRMTRSQSVMSAVSASDGAAAGMGETFDTWTSGTTGDNTARDPLYEQREEEEEEEEEEEGEEETDEDGQQGGRRRTRTSSSGGGRKTTKQPTAAKRSTRQRSAQPTSSTPKTSPQKRRTAAAGTAAAGSATSTPRRSTRRGGA